MAALCSPSRPSTGTARLVYTGRLGGWSSSFSCAVRRSIACAESGGWSYGVFGGGKELTIYLEWVACGIAGKGLHDFPFDDDAFPSSRPRVTERMAVGCAPFLTTARLLWFFYDLEDTSTGYDSDEDDGAVCSHVVWLAFIRHFRALVAA